VYVVEIRRSGEIWRKGQWDLSRSGENTHTTDRRKYPLQKYSFGREWAENTKYPLQKYPFGREWAENTKRNQLLRRLTKRTKKINKKTKNHHQKDPQTTGLFSITDDEIELPRELAIESCVRVVVSRRLLRNKYKQSEPFFWWKMGRDVCGSWGDERELKKIIRKWGKTRDREISKKKKEKKLRSQTYLAFKKKWKIK
jgi:hypothetical protein